MENNIQQPYKFIREKPVKCSLCRIKHKIKNVCNGDYFCSNCWTKEYGPKKHLKRLKKGI